MKFLKVFLIVLACVFILTACERKIEKNMATGNSPSPLSQESTPKPNDGENAYINEIKQALYSSINKDIWFNGEYSRFFTIEQQSFGIEIYKNEKLGIVSVLLDKKIKGSNYFNDGENFYTVHLWKGHRGYSSEYTGAIWESDIEKVKARLKELGYTFYQKSQFSFNSVERPIYHALISGEKDKVTKDIEKVVSENLKTWKTEGNYKIYIRDFSENDYHTYVVVEDKNNPTTWIYNVNLERNWGVAPGKFVEVNSEVLKYLSSKYKEISIRQMDIDLTQKASQVTQKPVLQNESDFVYTNSKLGFSITFPGTWKGKYTLEEVEKGIDVYYNSVSKGNKMARLFSIHIWGTEPEWDEWYKKGKDYGVPFRKIGVINGNVFIKDGPTEFIFSRQVESEKSDAEEYGNLLMSINSVIDTFKSLK